VPGFHVPPLRGWSAGCSNLSVNVELWAGECPNEIPHSAWLTARS